MIFDPITIYINYPVLLLISLNIFNYRSLSDLVLPVIVINL